VNEERVHKDEMDEQKWAEIQEIFSRAVDLPREQQRCVVEEMCAGDESVLVDVLAMLEEDGRANPLLDAGLDETARILLESGALPSLVRSQIGPYRLLDLLGEGGMGVVYLAERTDIGGKVAIKLLRDAWFSPMRRERFRSEQQTLAQLNHPSIARIYDSNTLEDGTPWFVMEYADGLPLTEYWQKQHGTIRECLRLFRRVCEAVEYAHSHAIIHRDLKPSNILVTNEGEVKLLDFGIAKQMDFDLGMDNKRTITGLRMMTPAYAAPEQIAGRAVGVYTDVYALGVLLYELLTGHLPHDMQTAEDIGKGSDRIAERPSQILRREQPEKRGQLSKSEWADLDVLVLKALEPEAARRYGTASALMRDVDALLAGRPLDAQPNRWSYTLGKFVRRNRRPLMALVAMVLLIAGTVVFYTVRLTRARNAALQEAARTRRIQQFTESLFDGGDKAAGPAQDLRAAQLLDRGRQEAASLAGDPEMQADMQETLGDIYQKLGKLDLADPLLAAALQERRTAIGGEHRKVAHSLVALGLLRKDEGKLDEAERLVRQGLEIDTRLLNIGDPDLTRTMLALGEVLEVRAKYDEARQMLEAALKQQPQGADATAATAENISELANVHFYQGRYDVSEVLNRQALEISRRLFGNDHPAVAQNLNNLGAIEMNRGNYAASEANYRQALAITEAWYGSDHPETAANLTALAQPLSFEKRDDEAQAALERALAIQKRVNGPVNSTVATTINELGMLAFNRDQYDAAKGFFNQAMDTWIKLYGDQHPFIAVAHSNLGSVCLHEKDYACAEREFREAVRRLDAVSSQSFNAAIAHIKLGRTLLRESRFADAERETLKGYTYVVKNMNQTNGYVVAARTDLAAIYDGLHNAERAAHFRAELAATTAAKR
jgi:serine/threonine protein kinase/tetratricopeptide (TPR) repeat protein